MLECLAHQASTRPTATALCFFDEGGQGNELTWSALAQRVEAFADHLTARGVHEQEIVLILTSSVAEQVICFLGALGCGAVPAILPHPSTAEGQVDALGALIESIGSARCRWVVAPDDRIELTAQLGHALERITPVALGAPRRRESGRRRLDDPLYLQLTSGMSGVAKAVEITERSLGSQLTAYDRSIGLDAKDRVVSCLPLSHHVGLVGAFLAPFCQGAVGYLSPFAWLLDPIRLVEQIDAQQATLTWLPNFACHLLVTRCAEASRARGLSLASLRAIISCGEPARRDTHELFARAFQDSGCRPEQLQVCYSAAENTFAITQTQLGQRVRVDVIEREAFEKDGRCVPAAQGAQETLSFVSCGRPVPGTEIRIAAGSEERQLGEIEIRGDSLAVEGWFRPGDLGYLSDGELFVVGRQRRPVSETPISTAGAQLESAIPAAETLLQIWTAVLGTRPGLDQDLFLELGADSLQAAAVVTRIRKELKVELAVQSLLARRTVREQTALALSRTPTIASVVTIVGRTRERAPLVLIHPAGGHSWDYLGLTKYVVNRPLCFVGSPAYADRRLSFRSVAETAAYYQGELERSGVDGPFVIGGWSFGGTVAFELGARLARAGRPVLAVLLFDTYPPLTQWAGLKWRFTWAVKNFAVSHPTVGKRLRATRALFASRDVGTRFFLGMDPDRCDTSEDLVRLGRFALPEVTPPADIATWPIEDVAGWYMPRVEAALTPERRSELMPGGPLDLLNQIKVRVRNESIARSYTFDGKSPCRVVQVNVAGNQAAKQWQKFCQRPIEAHEFPITGAGAKTAHSMMFEERNVALFGPALPGLLDELESTRF